VTDIEKWIENNRCEFASTKEEFVSVSALRELLKTHAVVPREMLGAIVRFTDSAIDSSFDGCDFDGFEIQSVLSETGVLVQKEQTAPCQSDACLCVEYSLNDGEACGMLFKSDEFKALIAASEVGNG
jgi:hypothetical protein